MNRTFGLLLLCILMWIWPPKIGQAAYVIELKTGGRIVTSHYWRENGQIRYYYLNGVVGIPDHLVLSIQDTDESLPEDKTIRAYSERLSRDERVLAEKDAVENEMEYAAVLRQNILNTDSYKSKYDAARKSNHEPDMNEALRVLAALREERAQFEKYIVELYQGVLPDWWNELLDFESQRQ